PSAEIYHLSLHDALPIWAGADFRLAYIDINDFKPFNDHYGYSLGDEVIRCLAAAVLAATHPGGDFVGHIGGDDFVVLFRGDGWRAECEDIVEHDISLRLSLQSLVV